MYLHGARVTSWKPAPNDDQVPCAFFGYHFNAANFVGSVSGRSTVIGGWSEMRSSTESFSSRIVIGKCGANR